MLSWVTGKRARPREQVEPGTRTRVCIAAYLDPHKEHVSPLPLYESKRYEGRFLIWSLCFSHDGFGSCVRWSDGVLGFILFSLLSSRSFADLALILSFSSSPQAGVSPVPH